MLSVLESAVDGVGILRSTYVDDESALYRALSNTPVLNAHHSKRIVPNKWASFFERMGPDNSKNALR